MRSVVLHELPAAAAVWRAYVLPWADLRTVNVTVVIADKNFSGPYECSLVRVKVRARARARVRVRVRVRVRTRA